MFVTPCLQDTLLAYAPKPDSYLHIPYQRAKPQNGHGGRLSVHFVPASAFIDWSLVQPAFHDQPAAAAAAAGDEQRVDAAAAAAGDEQHDDHTGRGDQPAADAAAAGAEQPDAAAADTGDEQHAEHTGRGSGGGGGRSGLEPKVIGLLVNLYRYNERECAETWSRVRASMDKLYNSRDNIARQVDAALSRDRHKRSWD